MSNLSQNSLLYDFRKLLLQKWNTDNCKSNLEYNFCIMNKLKNTPMLCYIPVFKSKISFTRLGLKCQTSVKVQPKILVKKNFEKKIWIQKFFFPQILLSWKILSPKNHRFKNMSQKNLGSKIFFKKIVGTKDLSPKKIWSKRI